MLGDIDPYHLRMLAENPWNGGGGYTPEQVGDMTKDQVFSLLCDLEVMKGKTMKSTKTVSTGQVRRDREGRVVARSVDGTSIRLKTEGKSLARRLMEAEQTKRK